MIVSDELFGTGKKKKRGDDDDVEEDEEAKLGHPWWMFWKSVDPWEQFDAAVERGAQDRASPKFMGLASLGLEIGVFCDFSYLT